MNRLAVPALAALVVLALCLAGWYANPAALLAGWLAAWWCWIGLQLGALANVWLHNLTGGSWGEAIRAPLLAFARDTWFVALLFLPVLLGLYRLYPWAGQADLGAARWTGVLAEPGFKSAWLAPLPFIARSLAWLLLWSVLARLSLRPALARSKGFAAAALILYALSTSLAALDWIMSLSPLWYSSVFGLLVLTAQTLGGMAMAIVLVARARPAPALLADLGNLLLAYLMTWAYLAFMQFLIIWAANLPNEILWYVARESRAWEVLARLLALLLFAVPALILLFRAAKRSPGMLAAVAGLVLAMLLVDAWWLVLPSVPAGRGDWWWAAPLGAAAVLAVLALQWRWRGAFREQAS
jgi:hypothetical protein